MARAKGQRGDTHPVAGDPAGGAFGLWLNKRELQALEIPLRHEITPQNTGWRLEFMEAGKVTARHTQGTRGIDVQPGDFLISSGDDMYLAIHSPAGKPAEPPAPQAADEDKPASGKPESGKEY
jgi:hypothetical protein